MISFIESFLELIYPEKNICQICNIYDESINDNYICKDCYAELQKILSPFCIKCNKGIDYNSEYGLCKECIRKSRYFDAIRSPYYYKGNVKKLIHDYKYCNKPYYYKLFGKLLVDYMIDIDYTNFDFIISVPLHKIKQRKRGYNQSELIAKYISKKFSIPYLDILKRVNNTTKQSNLSASSRQINLKNAFAIKSNRFLNTIKGKKILIVDDIFTTGTTINECSKILLTNGTSNVFGLTISR
ncbi:ComF family protein [Sedimentibacter sp. zth1]|uniref:ComF family protein n=1 Tax=Sedimentibacter sp. zth1 TaxID=2816908 RepID=UPI001A91B68D|nr:ComF family protein [Sedimentibacter sp. zth1]QSX05059.1 ComF family protein [Sedimentibacter sp. zth1]